MLRNIKYTQCKKIVVASFIYFAGEHSNRKVAGLLLELEVVAVDMLQNAMVIQRLLV